MVDGTRLRVDMLKEGDIIIAATANGKLTTDTVSLLSLARPETVAMFLTLTTDNNQSLTVTPDHHLPTGEACCSQLKKASELRAGDQLWMADNAHVAAVPVTISKINVAIDEGTFSPVLTAGSFPVIDGLITSFDAITQVQMKALTPWFESMLRVTGSANLFRRLVFGAGLRFIDGFETEGVVPDLSVSFIFSFSMLLPSLLFGKTASLFAA